MFYLPDALPTWIPWQNQLLSHTLFIASTLYLNSAIQRSHADQDARVARIPQPLAQFLGDLIAPAYGASKTMIHARLHILLQKIS